MLLVKTHISSVPFRNVSSKDDRPAGLPGTRRITGQRAMRALAHPVRIALLEALAHAGTLTATQASDLLGESPANCAFHLRTLAKYGFVEEAGGGRGRERPWRRVHTGLRVSADHADPATAATGAEVGRFLEETLLARARAALAARRDWPQPWQRDSGLGFSQYLLYLTPAEARQLAEQVHDLYQAYFHRADQPERRPPGALPAEALVITYPLLHLLGPEAAGQASGPETGED